MTTHNIKLNQSSNNFHKEKEKISYHEHNILSEGIRILLEKCRLNQKTYEHLWLIFYQSFLYHHVTPQLPPLCPYQSICQ